MEVEEGKRRWRGEKEVKGVEGGGRKNEVEGRKKRKRRRREEE